HIHVVPPDVPGVGSLAPLLREDAEAVAAHVRAEMSSASVSAALAMGSWTGGPEYGDPRDPLGVQRPLDIARFVPGPHAIAVADPTRSDREHLAACEDQVRTGRVKALKAYLGYLHSGPDSPGYRPYYELAERHRLPLVFHTGDTYSPRAKLRFAQPLLI